MSVRQESGNGEVAGISDEISQKILPPNRAEELGEKQLIAFLLHFTCLKSKV